MMDPRHDAVRRPPAAVTASADLRHVELPGHPGSADGRSVSRDVAIASASEGAVARVATISIPHATIRDALARILSSAAFSTVKRSRGLLTYLVEETLQGRANAINEYTIAQDVFGRDEHFDPRIDTCVRTEAWRLRQRLQAYYEFDGRNDPVCIAFVPRSFVPVFTATGEAVLDTRAAPRRISVVAESESDAGPAGQRLAARLTEELVRGLCQLSSLVPVLSDAAGAAELRLSCVVRQDGDNLRVIASLLGKGEDVCGVQAFSGAAGGDLPSPILVADAIVEMVSRSLSGRVAKLPVDLLDEDGGIRYLDLLLRSSHADRSRRLTELRAAVSGYQKIIEHDPADRLAHRRLIAALGLFLSLAPTATTSVMPRLMSLTRNVVSWDGSLSEVWLTLGLASSYVYKWRQTEISCRQAIAIAPLDPSPYILLGLSYLQQGKIKEALEAIEAALPLDPGSPMVANSYALTLNAARRFTEAAAVALQALEVDPEFVKLRLTLGEAKLNMGRLDESVEEFQAAYRSTADDATVCGFLGLAYGLSGEKAAANDILSKIRRSPDMRGQSNCAEAMIHLGLGRRTEAIAALGCAVERRATPGLVFANAVFDPIRSDRGFVKLQQQVAFAA